MQNRKQPNFSAAFQLNQWALVHKREAAEAPAAGGSKPEEAEVRAKPIQALRLDVAQYSHEPKRQKKN